MDHTVSVVQNLGTCPRACVGGPRSRFIANFMANFIAESLDYTVTRAKRVEDEGEH